MRLAKQYQGRPLTQERQVPQGARQAMMTKSPGATLSTSGADALDDACRLMTEQEREVVVNRALPIMQVGMANPAGLYTHQRFAGAGIRHTYSGEPHGVSPAFSYYSLNLMGHHISLIGSIAIAFGIVN